MKITKSEIKILLGIGILILVIDILLMKYWISTIKPDPFMSIGVESYRPHIFGVNILIGIIVFFFKKRLSILFFLNSIICYLIFSFFWNSWIENHPYSSTEYSFQIDNRKFVLGIDRNPDTFGIDEIVSESKDSLITIGMHEKVGDSLKLTSIQETMYFYDNKLSRFSISPNTIELNKIESVRSEYTTKTSDKGKFFGIRLTDKTVVGISPDSIQIAEMKREYGEDDFYTVADDVMWYNGQMLEVIDSLKIKYVHTDKRFIRIITSKDQIEINNDTSQVKWRYIYFNGKETLEKDVFEIINLNKFYE